MARLSEMRCYPWQSHFAAFVLIRHVASCQQAEQQGLLMLTCDLVPTCSATCAQLSPNSSKASRSNRFSTPDHPLSSS